MAIRLVGKGWNTVFQLTVSQLVQDGLIDGNNLTLTYDAWNNLHVLSVLSNVSSLACYTPAVLVWICLLSYPMMRYMKWESNLIRSGQTKSTTSKTCHLVSVPTRYLISRRLSSYLHKYGNGLSCYFFENWYFSLYWWLIVITWITKLSDSISWSATSHKFIIWQFWIHQSRL